MIRLLIFFAVPVAVLAPGIAAWAQSTGPETWEIVSSGPAPMRAAARSDATPVGEIPAKTRGLANLGCEGQTPFQEWIKFGPAEQQAARAKIWCQLSFDGKTGWVNGMNLGEHSGMAPAYNCSLAEGTVEQLICRDDALGRLDQRITKVYWAAMRAVLDRDTGGPQAMRALRQQQRGWINRRNACADTSPVRACVVDIYERRIATLETAAGGN